MPINNAVDKAKIPRSDGTSCLDWCCSGVVAWKVAYKRYICVMAIVQYTGAVNQIRGKLNGSVFNKSRTVFTLQRKQQNPRRNVGFSSEPRNIFSNAQRTWKALTGTQRTQWGLAAANNPSRNRFGDLVALSGYNQYIKAFMFATYAEQSPPTTPDTSPAPAPEVDAWDRGDNYWTVGFQGQPVINFEDMILLRLNDDPGFYGIVDVGLPISDGVTVYYGRYTFVGSFEATDNVEVDMSQNLGSRYPFPKQEQPYDVRLRIVYVPNGSVVYEQHIRGSANIL